MRKPRLNNTARGNLFQFAFSPTKVGDADCRWLEFIERKYGRDKYTYADLINYREIGSQGEGYQYRYEDMVYM